MFRHDQIIAAYKNILWMAFDVVTPLPLEYPGAERQTISVQYQRFRSNSGVVVLYHCSYNPDMCMHCGNPFSGKSKLHQAVDCKPEIVNVPTAAKRLLAAQGLACGTDSDGTALKTYLVAMIGWEDSIPVTDGDLLDDILLNHGNYHGLAWLPDLRVRATTTV